MYFLPLRTKYCIAVWELPVGIRRHLCLSVCACVCMCIQACINPHSGWHQSRIQGMEGSKYKQIKNTTRHKEAIKKQWTSAKHYELLYSLLPKDAAISYSKVKSLPYIVLMWPRGKLLPKYLVPLVCGVGNWIDHPLTACRIALTWNALSKWQTNGMGEIAASNFMHINWILGKIQVKNMVLNQSFILCLSAVCLFTHCRL